MLDLKWVGPGLKILDFDTETRPITYLGSDFTTGEPTALAWGFAHEGRRGIRCYAVSHEGHKGIDQRREMLEAFHVAYDEADVVTGHYIRGFDLPVIMGAMLDAGLPPLSDKLTIDTKQDLLKRKYVSASQESLGAMLGLKAPKVPMDQIKWRSANRFTPEGVTLTRRRVVGDVVQHMELRRKLTDMGWLTPPRMWTGSGNIEGGYVP